MSMKITIEMKCDGCGKKIKAPGLSLGCRHPQVVAKGVYAVSLPDSLKDFTDEGPAESISISGDALEDDPCVACSPECVAAVVLRFLKGKPRPKGK